MHGIASDSYHAECIVCGEIVYLWPNAITERSLEEGTLLVYCNQCEWKGVSKGVSKWPCPVCNGRGGESIPMRATSDYHRMHPSYRFEKCLACSGKGAYDIGPVPPAVEAEHAISMLSDALDILRGVGFDKDKLFDDTLFRNKMCREALQRIRDSGAKERMLRKLVDDIDRALRSEGNAPSSSGNTIEAADKPPIDSEIAVPACDNRGGFDTYRVCREDLRFQGSLGLFTSSLLMVNIETRIAQIRKLNLRSDATLNKRSVDKGCTVQNEGRKKKWWEF